MRVSEGEASLIIRRLEARRYGRKMESGELAQKAGVALEAVEQVESRVPSVDERSEDQIANTLGITVSLLRKVTGWDEFSTEEWNQFQWCLNEEDPGQPSPACIRLGFQEYEPGS